MNIENVPKSKILMNIIDLQYFTYLWMNHKVQSKQYDTGQNVYLNYARVSSMNKIF